MFVSEAPPLTHELSENSAAVDPQMFHPREGRKRCMACQYRTTTRRPQLGRRNVRRGNKRSWTEILNSWPKNRRSVPWNMQGWQIQGGS